MIREWYGDINKREIREEIVSIDDGINMMRRGGERGRRGRLLKYCDI